MSGLTKAQAKALSNMPDWIGAGLPADVIGAPRRVLDRLCMRGFAVKERPNEEWPNVYASTVAGRQALTEQPK